MIALVGVHLRIDRQHGLDPFAESAPCGCLVPTRPVALARRPGEAA
jgi:hypothetical protein